MPTSTTFSFTEEAFLLSSLHEVVKVWSRGSGQANFALKVIDGVAELNLNFKLGHPNDLHCAPPHNVPPSYQDQDQDLAPPGLKKRRHHKSAARRERDRLRAQAFQAGRETGRETRKLSLILPFSGKILSLDNVPETESTAAPAVTPQVAAASVVTPEEADSKDMSATPLNAVPPPAVFTRRILANSTQKNYIDVNVAINDVKTHLKARRVLNPNSKVCITIPTEIIKPSTCEKLLGGFVHQDVIILPKYHLRLLLYWKLQNSNFSAFKLRFFLK
jgi:hypothetical protein